MNEFVVYTVLTGNYEDIIQPQVVDDRFDYVLFSNDSQNSVGIWNVRPIPSVVSRDNKRLSRYPKTHPESLLSDYKASLYIDANIQILDRWVYERFLQLFEQGIEYAGIQLALTGRDCIYDHAFDMCQWRVEYDHVAIRQCHALYKNGFPHHFGLNENNVIFRIHNERMKTVDEEWWNWITNYSRRDQFSYMYCLWKHNVEINYFLPAGEDTRNGSHFRLIDHNGRKNVKTSKTVKLGLYRSLYIKCKSFNPDRSLYKWRKIYESRSPLVALYLDSLITIISSIPELVRHLMQRNR